MANMQRSRSAGQTLGFIVALVLAGLVLAWLFDRTIMAMGGHPVAMCALIPVIREYAGTATGLVVFVAGLVLLALAGGRSRFGAGLLLVGALLAAVPDLATAALDPGNACDAATAIPAPVSPPRAAPKPPRPRSVLTPL